MSEARDAIPASPPARRSERGRRRRPRPDAAAKAAAPERGPGRPDGPPTTGTGPSTPPPRRQPPPPATPEDDEGRGESPGVEDLAWAGITVAAEAATLGVRLLSRAVDAVRKPPDPR